jgi:hypothetical protein
MLGQCAAAASPVPPPTQFRAYATVWLQHGRIGMACTSRGRGHDAMRTTDGAKANINKVRVSVPIINLLIADWCSAHAGLLPIVREAVKRIWRVYRVCMIIGMYVHFSSVSPPWLDYIVNVFSLLSIGIRDDLARPPRSLCLDGPCLSQSPVPMTKTMGP